MCMNNRQNLILNYIRLIYKCSLKSVLGLLLTHELSGQSMFCNHLAAPQKGVATLTAKPGMA